MDYKVQNLSTFAHYDTVSPMQRAVTAINKFGRISESEITTPESIAKDMKSLIPDDWFIDFNMMIEEGGVNLPLGI